MSKTAVWVKPKNESDPLWFECSECGTGCRAKIDLNAPADPIVFMPYCPGCGAQMTNEKVIEVKRDASHWHRHIIANPDRLEGIQKSDKLDIDYYITDIAFAQIFRSRTQADRYFEKIKDKLSIDVEVIRYDEALVKAIESCQKKIANEFSKHEPDKNYMNNLLSNIHLYSQKIIDYIAKNPK